MNGASPFGVPVILPDQANSVRPADRLGRGATTRVATEASSGRTWYFCASVQNRDSSSLSLAGFLAATSSSSVQSLATSCSSQGNPARSWLTAPATSHGGRITFVLVIQPS